MAETSSSRHRPPPNSIGNAAGSFAAIVAICGHHTGADDLSARRARRMQRQRSGRGRVRPADGRARQACCSRSRTAACRCTSRRYFIGPRPRSISRATRTKSPRSTCGFRRRCMRSRASSSRCCSRTISSASKPRSSPGLTLAGAFQYITLGRFGRVDMTLAFLRGALAVRFFLVDWPQADRDAVVRAGNRQRADAVCPRDRTGAGGAGEGAGRRAATARRDGNFRSRRRPPARGVSSHVDSRDRRRDCCSARAGTSPVGWAANTDFSLASSAARTSGDFSARSARCRRCTTSFRLLLNSGPLSVLVPIAVVMALRSRASRAEEIQIPAVAAPREAVRLFAIFWIVTVVFFSIAAYKRRAYLLPLWPPSAVMLAWMVTVASERFGGIALKARIRARCAS